MPSRNWPALLTTTSRRPNASTACRTAENTAARSVTSRGRASRRPPYCSARPASGAVSRAVPTTRSPRSRAASATTRPRPRGAPVTNQTRDGDVCAVMAPSSVVAAPQTRRDVSLRSVSRVLLGRPPVKTERLVYSVGVTPPRNPDPRRRSERSRRAILDAARALVAETGYPRLTIEAVAARAGVGKQTIYRCWPAKGAVLLDAVLALSQTAEGDITLPDPGDIEADLKTLMRATAAEFATPAFEAPLRALNNEVAADPELAAA